MRSSSRGLRFVGRARGLWLAAPALVLACAWSSVAGAQQSPQGFAVERFYPAAPGGGWLVMDDLAMRGGLGGAIALTSGYAHNPLRVSDGVQSVNVVSDQAFFGVGLAVTYDRFRAYANLDSPLVVAGDSGKVGGYTLAGPNADLGKNPDGISDPRVGFDVRLLGGPRSALRVGVGAQLIFPNGNRSDYLSDGSYRAMGRVLVAGNVGLLAYAGHVGVHVRPLDDAPAPGSPVGSELLFGVAAGPRIPVGSRGHLVAVVGPEIYGQTAFRSFLSANATGVEALFSARLEGTGDDGPQVRVKLGIGGGLDQRFGAPEWRMVFGIEVFDHSTDRDKDGVLDGKDACPDVPGIKTVDAKTNGCPAAVPDGYQAHDEGAAEAPDDSVK